MRGEHDHYTLGIPSIYPERCKKCPYVEGRKDFTRDFTGQTIVKFGGPDAVEIKPSIEINCQPLPNNKIREIFINASNMSRFLEPGSKTIYLKGEVSCPEEVAKTQNNG